MKPCQSIEYNEYWPHLHLDDIFPSDCDEELLQFIGEENERQDFLLRIAMSIKYNGVNHSFIRLAKPKYEGVIPHIEYIISPQFSSYFISLNEKEIQEAVISIKLSYLLSIWFDYDNLKEAFLYSYALFCPIGLQNSVKKKRIFESKINDSLIDDYAKGKNLSTGNYKLFINKLKVYGLGDYFDILTPHEHLDYLSTMSLITHYLSKDIKRAEKLALIYFPPNVINEVLIR